MERTDLTTAPASDEVIIGKILAGEKALFEVLVRRYNQLLYTTARSFGLNHQDAQDMMQESHVAAYTQLAGFKMKASYKTWLTKIHIHKCYHKLNYGALKYEDTTINADQSITAKQTSKPGDPDHHIMNRELARVLQESLQQLPIQYRTVFLLREMEGFSVTETAELLQITPINVKVRLSRSKTMLQQKLTNFYSETELFEFHEVYCNRIVNEVFKKITGL